VFEEAPRCPRPYAKNCNPGAKTPGIHYEIYPTGKRIQSFNMATPATNAATGYAAPGYSRH
jgi:hypothetical protein